MEDFEQFDIDQLRTLSGEYGLPAIPEDETPAGDGDDGGDDSDDGNICVKGMPASPRKERPKVTKLKKVAPDERAKFMSPIITHIIGVSMCG
jgi:hypothetical protein